MASVLPNDSKLQFPDETIVIASAGSGKTTALTYRFLQFLLSPRIPNNKLRNILAITFTNNAALEMKHRVLALLRNIALGRGEVVREIGKLVNIRENELREKAAALVEHILDNYSDFQVQTIDSFLTRVFKSSSVEFGFPPDFEIVLGSDELLDEAFDTFARTVARGSDSAKVLAELVEILVESKESKGKFPWNPYADLAWRVKELYQRIVRTALPLKEDDLRAEIRQHGVAMVTKIKQINDLIASARLPATDRFRDFVERMDERRIDTLIHYKVPDPPIKKTGALPGAYERFLTQTESIRKEVQAHRSRLVLLSSYNYFHPYIYAHRMLEETLERIKRQRGQVDLGDLTKKLAHFIREGTVPEIYLNLGERIAHFLIDEFQDTAPIQWKTLEPLIENSLSMGGSLFVVGDMKQSIYTFRGADWRIMKRLLEEPMFPSVQNPLIRRLETNYRSSERIVEFGKEVFHTIVPQRVVNGAERISGLADYQQETHKEKRGRGYVEVNVIEGDTDERPEKSLILSAVHDCLTRGYRKRDLAILTPQNDDVIRVSGWLNEAGYEFIPYSTLDIRTRKIVRELLALLRFLDSPVDTLSFVTFLLGDLFEKLLRADGENVSRDDLRGFILSSRENRNRPLYTQWRSEFEPLWRKYFDEFFNVVGYVPLYDLASDIMKQFRVFELVPGEEAAMMKLLEVVKNFEERGENTLKEFILFSEEQSEDADWNIVVPSDVDAIKVMTVHKSKGLGFPVVIVLLYDVPGRYDRYFMEEMEDGVRLVRVTKKLAEDSEELAELYREKNLRSTVDELNRLYVALTRAEEEMYVVSVTYDKKPEPSSFLPAEKYKPSVKPLVKREEPQEEPQAQIYHTPIIKIHRVETSERLAVEELRRGEIIHEVLSRIAFIDGDPAVAIRDGLEAQRKSSRDGIDADGISKTLTAFFEESGIKEYFKKITERQLLNEQDFVSKSGRWLRMDRVVVDKEVVTVIDYKTGDENDEHVSQVKEYMDVLQEVYPGRKIHGILAYVDRKVLKEVK
ncbi:MAG TPA: UvrD-helicase domain-containing protein [Bacteroidota bacterium]|nr:UvrD-helicase domain-containing protein [Bacteroidota bacterium]